jgi:serine/threonine protein kinase/DNA-binding response OmpR family regulator
MSESTPSRFGDYVLLQRIGDGGMAEIFLAKRHGYSGFEKHIALKRILPRYSGNETFVRMLIQEAKLAADLQHFNIVQVLDLGDVDGQVYLAMEYVNGKDLASILSAAYRRAERLPVAITCCIATEFLSGLDYAHRKVDEQSRPLGIIHRDISPQNILISFEGEVKVTDFGIARFISEKADLTLPGNLHGKFGYMSPEQVGSREIDQRSDIFSAGVVIWEMLTGRRLFRGGNPKETIDLVANAPVLAPSELNPEVPASIDRIILASLERDPDARVQTVGALLGELSRASEALPRRAAPRDVSVYMRRHFGRIAPRPTTPRPRIRSRITASPDRRLLGEILRENTLLTTEDLNIGLAEQRARGDRIGNVLVGLGILPEDQVARALAEQFELPWQDNAAVLATPVLPGLAARFPKDAAERTGLVPFQQDGAGTVRMFGADPTSESAQLEARVILGAKHLDLVVVTPTAIRDLVATWYRPAEPEAPCVLVADGAPADVEATIARLRDEGMDVVDAADGREARQIVDSREVVVALLDAGLPRVDGFNLMLRLHARLPEATVFITSSRDDPFRQSKALEMGAEDFLTKPLAPETVAAKVRRAVRRQAPRATSASDWGPEVGVGGDLLHMSVVDIVQSLEVAQKSAEVEIQYDDGRSGRVFVSDGGLFRCEPLHGTPSETFFRLARPGPGRFRIRYGAVTGHARNLEQPTTFLLMEAMRRLDERDRETEEAESYFAPGSDVSTFVDEE